jgi:hypothetical protein
MEMNAETHLLEVTGQSDLKAAVAYLAEGHFVAASRDRSRILRALCSIDEKDLAKWSAALKRFAREVATSTLNTASVLLKPDLITPPSAYRHSLDVLASKCPSKSIGGGLDYKAVVAAQREDSNVISTLGAIAGIAWGDLIQRAELPSPSQPDGVWTQEGVKKVFNVINAIICNTAKSTIPNGIPARPIELLGDPKVTENPLAGWAQIEAFRIGGVPYEILLAQRAEGGAWRTHRDRTGSKFAIAIADELCAKLMEASVQVLRARKCGGKVSAQRIKMLVGGGVDQVALILVRDDGRPFGVVAISVANDGGSAAKSGARLRGFPARVNVPVFLVVAGYGWSGRNETAELATEVGGRIFSEGRVSEFVNSVIECKKGEEL